MKGRITLGTVLASLSILLSGCQPTTEVSGGGGTVTEAGPAAKTTKRIILITNGPDPYWDACYTGMKKAAEDLHLADEGLTVEKQEGDGSPQGQISKLRQFASQPDIAAIGISPTNADNPTIAEEMKKLRDKGIPVATLDSDLIPKFHDCRFAYLGTNNTKAGEELGNCAKALRPDGGKYVCFVGLTSAQNAQERIAGFGQGAGDKFQLVDTMTDSMDQNRAKENVRNAMSNHPDATTLVGIWAYNAPAIVQAVEDRNERSKYLILTFDASTAAVRDIGNGMIDAMLVQNPYQIGYDGTRLLHALIKDDQETVKELYPNYGQPGGDIFHTGLKIVVPNKESTLKKDLFDPNTEFMTIEEFRGWMKARGLISS